MVVDNALYRSLAELIGPIGRSAEKAGNVWEQLCWHAYEHDKGAFILAVIWNTSNRRLLQHPATSQGHLPLTTMTIVANVDANDYYEVLGVHRNASYHAKRKQQGVCQRHLLS